MSKNKENLITKSFSMSLIMYEYMLNDSDKILVWQSKIFSNIYKDGKDWYKQMKDNSIKYKA